MAPFKSRKEAIRKNEAAAELCRGRGDMAGARAFASLAEDFAAGRLSGLVEDPETSGGAGRKGGR
jgi:hypothetical protein